MMSNEVVIDCLKCWCGSCGRWTACAYCGCPCSECEEGMIFRPMELPQCSQYKHQPAEESAET